MAKASAPQPSGTKPAGPPDTALPLCSVTMPKYKRGNRSVLHVADDVVSQLTGPIREALRATPEGDITFHVSIR